MPKVVDKCSGPNISTKTLSDGTRIVEKEKDLTLSDGSSVEAVTKERSKKRVVVLPNGTHFLETITKTHTTKTERSVIPPEESDDDDGQIHLEFSKTDSASKILPNGAQFTATEKVVTLPDGSTIVTLTEASSKKRVIILPDSTRVLSVATKTCITKTERSLIPSEKFEDVKTDSFLFVANDSNKILS